MANRLQESTARLCAILVALGIVLLPHQPACADSDDYPSQWRAVPQDSVLDDWQEFNRECTSWVAWRLHSRNGFEMPFHDMADKWGSRAQTLGYVVNMTPAVGAVAWWSSMHVAWVESISASGQTVHISEYNFDYQGNYSERDIGASTPSGYIHFKDMSGGTVSGPPPGMGSKIAAARNADGRLSVFYIGANSGIYYRSQNSPGSAGWSAEIHIPAYAKSIAAVTDAGGRIELFYVGANDGLYHRWQPWANAGQWSPEEYFPANIRAVAAANNGNGIVAVIGVGSNSQLYIMQQPSPDSWNGQWFNIPAQSVDIAMATSADGRNELFHVGGNFKLYSRWERSPGCCWSDETWFEANIRKVAAARNADGRMEVFAIGSNAEIYNKWQLQPGGAWYDSWARLPARARYLAAATNTNGTLEIFYVGTNNAVYHRRQTQAGCCWGAEDILPANVAP